MELDQHEQTKTKSDLITMKEVYFHSVLLATKSISQFKFYDDPSVQSGTDRYVLLAEDKDPAIFHVSGTVTQLNGTPAGAVKHRRRKAKLDEYTVRLRIDNKESLKTVEEGCCTLLDLLKNTAKACETIAVLSGLVESRLSFSLDDITIKVSNYSNDVFYFNRKVATPDPVPTDDGETPDFMLQFPHRGVNYPVLLYPTGWNLNPLIPVTDRDALPLKPENIDLPRPATVYFEMKQGCHNFDGDKGPVKQIVLIPSIIAIKVHPQVYEDLAVVHKAKRRRVSCL